MSKKASKKKGTRALTDPLFADFENKIRDLDGHIRHLETFRNHLHKSCFDDEDRQEVEKKLVELQQVRAGLQDTLAKKREIYVNQVKALETKVNTRRQELEQYREANAIFDTFPDLLTFFVQKQSRMQASMTAVRNGLLRTD